MAKGFAANGAILHLVGRREGKLQEAKRAIEQVQTEGSEIHLSVLYCRLGSRAHDSIPADASDRDAVKAFVSSLTRLDVLINNAGVVFPDPPSTHLTPVAELQASLVASPEESWSKSFQVNVEAPFYLAASVLHLLAQAPDAGRIINISSIGSVMADPSTHQPAYQASKAAVNHLTRILASKFRDTGVRVNAICETKDGTYRTLIDSQLRDTSPHR
jgi:NAD(P)-dependent dehydrogenase (short-subunit alcohol dehydrogenase family)